MSYRNPKAAPLNLNVAAFKGLETLASDVYKFANEEKVRKGQLIVKALLLNKLSMMILIKWV